MRDFILFFFTLLSVMIAITVFALFTIIKVTFALQKVNEILRRCEFVQALLLSSTLH